MDHIQWVDKQGLILLDQRTLPLKEDYVTCENHKDVASAIKNMVVRGAPAIGAAAAYGMALAALEYLRVAGKSPAGQKPLGEWLKEAARDLKESRPTAVNLSWAVDRLLETSKLEGTTREVAQRMVAEARKVAAEDIEGNRRIGAFGASLLPAAARILTYCNAGALATAGYGTALGVIRAGMDMGKVSRVYVCETRPYLQGARLTAYELCREGIPTTLITDNMAGYIMYNKMSNVVVVGADRVIRSGYAANKVGTYTLAVLARQHGIPFYMAAPLSTFDMETTSPRDIPIEERDPGEVTHLAGIRVACPGVEVFNPSFDITPPSLITALITERGIVMDPNEEKIRKLF